MKKNENSLLFLLAIFAAVGILVPASLTPNLFIFKPFGWDEVGRLLAFLILISLFLERALEVFITTWRRSGEEEFDNETQFCERRIAGLNAQIELKNSQPETTLETQTLAAEHPSRTEERVRVTQGSGNVDELHVELSETLSKLEGLNLARSRYKMQTRKIALWTALFIGLLISGVGIRALETLIDLKDFASGKPTFYDGQICLFRVLDTLLTGGLIAGGSDGIHKLTQVFTTFLEETRNQIKDKPSA